MAFGLSSALLVIGCGGPEYRPSASAEANQSVKQEQVKPKESKEIVIAKPDQTGALDPSKQAVLNACLAAAANTAAQPNAGAQSGTPAMALTATAPAAAASTVTITCNGQTYIVPKPTIGQQNAQPNAQSQQTRPVVQMPQQ
jgi:hypothetical protein